MHLPLGRAFEDKVCRWEGLSGSNKSAAVCDLCQIQGKRRQTYINGGEGSDKGGLGLPPKVCPKFVPIQRQSLHTREGQKSADAAKRNTEFFYSLADRNATLMLIKWSDSIIDIFQ